jgi:hypothetical protein
MKNILPLFANNSIAGFMRQCEKGSMTKEVFGRAGSAMALC